MKFLWMWNKKRKKWGMMSFSIVVSNWNPPSHLCVIIFYNGFCTYPFLNKAQRLDGGLVEWIVDKSQHHPPDQRLNLRVHCRIIEKNGWTSEDQPEADKLEDDILSETERENTLVFIFEIIPMRKASNWLLLGLSSSTFTGSSYISCYIVSE